MASDYDQLEDLWYAWLFSRLHWLITKNVILPYRPSNVLDVGCGTGFQSFLFSQSGAVVTGIDISDGLIEVANEKLRDFQENGTETLFQSYFPFVDRYNEKIHKALIANSQKITPPTFVVGDAEQLPFKDQQFDHLNCCGSTLNFVEDYEGAIREMSRVLRPSGTFSIEVDARWNFDLFWSLIDSVIGGHFGYDGTFLDSCKNISKDPREHIRVNYPFGESDDPVMMDIWLFSKSGLKRDLESVDFKVENTQSIHSITNLIPSTILDSSNPSKLVRKAFNALLAIEELSPMSNFPGCSLVLFGKKQKS